MKNLIGLVLISILLSCSPAKKYAESSKGWEKEIQGLEQLDKKNTYPDNSILFIGSSSIRLWEDIDKAMAPYPVIQRGFGGSNLSSVLFYEDRLINPHDFRAIVVFVANDIYGGQNDRTPKEVLTLYKQLVKSIRKDHKKEPIFFVQITPTESRWHVWDKTNEANKLIKNYSEKKKNLFYIQTAESFLGEDGMPIPAYFREDKLHQTQLGYEVWGGIIKTALDKNLK